MSQRYVSLRKKTQRKQFELKYQLKAQHKAAVNKQLNFYQDEILAIKNESGGFYLCRALQNVYSSTGNFKIQWLEADDGSQQTYHMSYADRIEANSILASVNLRRIAKKTYCLPSKQMAMINRLLQKSAVGKDGEIDDSDPEEEMESDDNEPVRKKSKQVERKSSAKTGGKKLNFKRKPKEEKPKKNSSGAQKPKEMTKKRIGERKPNEKKEKKKKVAGKEHGIKKRQAKVLVPRPDIKILEKDPFMESREKVPFVSPTPHSKLVLRAVNLNDTKLLSQLINDVSNVSTVTVPHSVDYHIDSLQLALLHDNAACVKMICSEIVKSKRNRVSPTTGILTHKSTGKFNTLSLGGIRAIRKLAMSRGSREGNNAFTKDLDHATETKSAASYIEFALRVGVSKNTLDTYVAARQQTSMEDVYQKIYVAVRYGHRKLAAELMDARAKSGYTSFGFLHRDVIAFENEDLRAGIRVISVKKKTWDNYKITPLHCAAINPNTKYLAALLNILPEYNIVDASQRRPIHYAAACEGPGPLKLLLNRGIAPDETDNSGMTVLHIACDANRSHNVEVLLERASSGVTAQDGGQVSTFAPAEYDDAEADAKQDRKANKFGIGGINRPIDKVKNDLFGYTPLHLAAQKGYINVVNVLLKYGAAVDCDLGASKNKLTPLMVACTTGHLDVVRLLVKHGAKPLQKDKLGRTALSHAALNGHTHVISFLLNIGVDIEAKDTSGNTALHYAVAYGWYFSAKLLLDVGASPCIGNDWKTTPTAIAFLKGHVGLTDLLLEHPSVDINFRLDSGMTLLSLACSSPLVEGIVQQIEYLVVDKGADCTLTDADCFNALHHLAKNNVKQMSKELSGTAMQNSIAIAKLLVQEGCNPAAVDSDGLTPVMHAVRQGNYLLMNYLANIGSGVSAAVDKRNKNILHLFAEQCMQLRMADLLSVIHKNLSEQSMLVDMAKQFDHDGFTPLLRACYVYKTWNGVVPDLKDDKAKDPADSGKEDELKKKEAWRSAGLDFIKGLITLCGANLAEKIQKKHFEKSESVTKKKKVPTATLR